MLPGVPSEIAYKVPTLQEGEDIDEQLVKIKTYITDLSDIINESEKQDDKKKESTVARLAKPTKQAGGSKKTRGV